MSLLQVLPAQILGSKEKTFDDFKNNFLLDSQIRLGTSWILKSDPETFHISILKPTLTHRETKQTFRH